MSKKVDSKPEVVAAVEVTPRTLYVQVITHDAQGKVIGTRIVDMYHFGTRNWLHDHTWWAMHNGHSIETEIAHPDDVNEYLAAAKIKLAEKFNKAA